MTDVIGTYRAANPWGGLDWPAIPGHCGAAWFLPLVAAWHKLQVRLH